MMTLLRPCVLTCFARHPFAPFVITSLCPFYDIFAKSSMSINSTHLPSQSLCTFHLNRFAYYMTALLTPSMATYFTHLSPQIAYTFRFNLLALSITTCFHHNLLVPSITTCLRHPSQPTCTFHHNLLAPSITTCLYIPLIHHLSVSSRSCPFAAVITTGHYKRHVASVAGIACPVRLFMCTQSLYSVYTLPL